MKTPLLPTQVVDVERALAVEDMPNFSEPGTGKTLTTVGMIEAFKLPGGTVVCPPVACLMWQRVLSDELGARVQWLKNKTTLIDKKADFYVMSYGVVVDHCQQLLSAPQGALVIDESHYIKNIESARTQAILGPAGDGIDGLYENSLQCWMLTGTPIERYADDLWTQLRATQPEVLQKYGALSLDEFQMQFCRMEWKEYANGAVQKRVSTANSNERLLNRMLYNQEHGIGAIRRTMEEVDEFMPKTVFRDILVKAKISKELKSLLVGMTEHDIMEAILAGGDKITTARRLMGMAKVDDLVKYIKEQARDHAVLVGFWHEDVGKDIYMKLTKGGFAANLLYGGTSAEARERIKNRFIHSDIDIIVGQIQAMGVAMDGLQSRGWHVIMAERDWSWAKMEQFYKRLARRGQKMATQVDFCTSDEVVDTALEKVSLRKRDGMLKIVG